MSPFSQLVIFVLLVTSSAYGDRTFDRSEYTEEVSNRLLNRIAKSVIRRRTTLLGEIPGLKIPDGAFFKSAADEVLDALVEPLTESSESSAVPCNVCVTAMSLMMSLIQSGASYEDLKPLAIEVCYEVVSAENWNPETLCDPALDTYGPHVEYVLKVTDKSARYICTFFGPCAAASGHSLTTPYDSLTRSANPSLSANNSTTRVHGDVDLLQSLDKSFQPIRLLHFTDMHRDPHYAAGYATRCDMPLCCRAESNGVGAAKTWGDYECNIPSRTVDHLLYFVVNELRPDMIAYTGDTFQHTVWDQPQNETIESSNWFTERLRFFFPGIPAYNTIGNHEMSPTNLWSTDRPEMEELSAEMFTHWERLSKFTAAQRETIMRGYYYTTSPFRGLRVLAYNSQYSVTENFYALLTFEQPEYPAMLQWMEDTLSTARQSGEKVILLGHHPTGGSGKVPGYTDFIIDLQARYSDIIVLHLLGHNHDDKFSVVRDSFNGEARGVQISSPSMTSYTNVNPSLRLFHLDPLTYQPLSMMTYHLDINSDGNSFNPAVKLTYNTADDYDMPDLSPQSFEQLINRLEVDSEFVKQFRANMYTGTGFEGSCNERCVARLVCDLRHAHDVARRQCFDSIPLS